MKVVKVSFATVLCAALSVAAAATQAPKLRLAEVESVAPTRYRVEMTLDPDQRQFSGTIQINLIVEKPLETLWLNASHLTIQEASLAATGTNRTAKASASGTDFLALQFDGMIPVGPAELRIRYTGAIRQDTGGVFRLQDLGNWYILTQFESTEARSAFPCFDEPSYKVPWQLTLHVPAGDRAVSNTPVARESSAGNARTYVFKETKPLPSYLIAFGVGPFEFVNAGTAGKNHVPVRIVVPKGRSAEAKYAAEVTATILTRLENYFGIPYPYEKSDEVSVPAEFGAMENAGMVTYQQSWLLANPATDSIERQRNYASVAAHELAHQWFGDLVTPVWWNDLWLNEAFATWMSQKILAEWKPEWKTDLDDVESRLGAERADSLVSARKIRQEIVTKGDIDNAVDEITYDKGAAVIGMFERWVGPEQFQKGIRSYLVRYSFRNATAGEFLNEIESASGKKEVAKAFSTFLDQPGVPMVPAALNCAGKAPALDLAQSRYVPLGSRSSGKPLWEIPICVRYGAGRGAQNACMLFSQPKTGWPLTGARSCPAWVEGNADARGYYRVDYQGGLLAALTNNTEHLDAAERTELMGSAAAMASGGKLPEADALRLAEKLHDDSERHVVSGALRAELAIEPNLVPANLAANYRRFLLKNFQARAHELGWAPKPGESDDIRLLRPRVVSAVATDGGDEALAKQAEDLARRWLKDRKAVAPDMVDAVLDTAAWYGDAVWYDQMLNETEKTRDSREKEQLIQALADFRDPKLLEKGLEEVLAGRLSLNDSFRLFSPDPFAGPAARKVPFEFVKAHLDRLLAGNPTIQGFSIAPQLPIVGRSLCDAGSRKELAAFFEPLEKKYDGLQHNFDETLESVDQCIAVVAAESASVREFLEKY